VVSHTEGGVGEPKERRNLGQGKENGGQLQTEQWSFSITRMGGEEGRRKRVVKVIEGNEQGRRGIGIWGNSRKNNRKLTRSPKRENRKTRKRGRRDGGKGKEYREGKCTLFPMGEGVRLPNS